MVTNNSNCNMSVLSKLEKALPKNTFFGSQDLSLGINNYTIEVDEISFRIFGYSGKMSITIQADQKGMLFVKQILKALNEIINYPVYLQLDPKNSQSKLYIKNKTDLTIIKYCAEIVLSQLHQKKMHNKLPEKIDSFEEYIENPFA